MDIRQIQHFLAAVRHGNLTLAAAELNLSQPALTKSIQRLEKRFGVKLMERGRFGITPTAFGLALVEHAKVISAELHHAESAIDALRGVRRGHVVLGCGPSESARLLPLAITRLRKKHPDIRITVLYGLNEALMPMVRQGEAEFALSSVPGYSADPDLVHESLYTDSGCVAARGGHPLARKRPIEAKELAAYPWILARRQELERRALDDLFVAAGLEPVAAEIESTSASLIKSLVMQTDFLTFMPREMMHWEEKAGQLAALNVGGPDWSRSVGLTYRARASLSPAGRALVDAIKASSAELAPRPLERKQRAGAPAER